MKKIKDIKKKMTLKFEKLTERELNFLTGGTMAAAGSSGSGSGSSDIECSCCDGTIVHCCFIPPVL